jgi:thiosulfate/3-mercaptopyruvate sulfurtransferase
MLRLPVRLAAFSVGALALASIAEGQQSSNAAPDSMLVSTAWLADRLNDPSIVLLFTGQKADYDTGHIPGARFLPMQTFAVERAGISTELADAPQLEEAFASVGLSDKSRVVVYGSPTAGARVFLTLQYMGFGGRVSVLDGGMTAWRAEGRALATDVPSFARGKITARPRNDVVVNADYVKSNIDAKSVRIVDARVPEFYEGRNAPNHNAARPGHIPSAGSIPYTTLLDPQTHLLDRAKIDSLFHAAGVKPGDRVVTYCHIGMQASLLYFAARLAGYDARMYDGAYEEWSNRADLPIVGPVAKPDDDQRGAPHGR